MKKQHLIIAAALSAALLLGGCAAASPSPSAEPGASATVEPTASPSVEPTVEPTVAPTETPASTLEGSAEDIMKKLVEESGAEFGMAMYSELNADAAQNLTDLPADLFTENVVDAYSHASGITSYAYVSAVFECKDEASAATVRDALKSFDVMRWICVAPEECFVMDAGNYVFFSAGNAEGGALLRTCFEGLAGTANADIFYERPTE